MNRREFIRTAIATTVLLAAGVTGVFEITDRAETNQPAAQPGIQLPQVATESQSTPSAALAPTSSTSVESAYPTDEVSTTTVQEYSTTSSSTESSSYETPLETATTSQYSSTSSTSTSSTSTSSSSTTTEDASGPAGYVLVAELSSLQGETYAYFTHPTAGSCILVYYEDQWNAFSAICTHRVCTLEYESSELYCPCHGATFDASDGDVTRGPARVQLAQYGVMIQDGQVWVSETAIN